MLNWEVISQLEGIGLKVIGITCDGAAANRKFFKYHMHQSEKPDGGVVYKTKNKHASDNRDIFFFSDVPHLVKTVRNCWLSSGYAKGHTRLLTVRICLIIYTQLYVITKSFYI